MLTIVAPLSAITPFGRLTGLVALLPIGSRFSNMRFQVKDGAAVVFDFERTTFGPNTGYVSLVAVGPVELFERRSVVHV